MANTQIEWTNKTWNPVVGCNKVSPGCKHCYAEVMHRRLMKMQPKKYKHPFLDGAYPHPPSLPIPLYWKKPQMIFVNSMSDLFHKDIPFEFIEVVFEVMVKADWHIYQILTKRIERMVAFISYYLKKRNWETLPRFIWPGTSVENQEMADKRIPELIKIPGMIWLSVEPLLGPVDLTGIIKHRNVARADGSEKQIGLNCLTGKVKTTIDPKVFFPGFQEVVFEKIKWVVVGGESGKAARPTHPDWIIKIKNDCEEANVPFFFKQWGGWIPQYNAYTDDTINRVMKTKLEKNEKIVGSLKTRNLVLMKKVGKTKAKKEGVSNILYGKTYLNYPAI